MKPFTKNMVFKKSFCFHGASAAIIMDLNVRAALKAIEIVFLAHISQLRKRNDLRGFSFSCSIKSNFLRNPLTLI
jgi:hypothetical protein